MRKSIDKRTQLLDLEDIQFRMSITTIGLGGDLNSPIGIESKGYKVSGSGNTSRKKASSERRNGRTYLNSRLFKENDKDMFNCSTVATESSHHHEK